MKPEDVDYILCTHLHWDHVGWNTQLIDGRWVPTFPNAKHIISRTEYDYWDAAYRRGDPSIHCVSFADSVLPVKKAEQVMLVDDDYEFDSGVILEPCFGHSPGHVVVNIADQGDRGVVDRRCHPSPDSVPFPLDVDEGGHRSQSGAQDPHRAHREACRNGLAPVAGAFPDADVRSDREGRGRLSIRSGSLRACPRGTLSGRCALSFARRGRRPQLLTSNRHGPARGHYSDVERPTGCAARNWP